MTTCKNKEKTPEEEPLGESDLELSGSKRIKRRLEIEVNFNKSCITHLSSENKLVAQEAIVFVSIL